jgi:hypothetical protein
MLKNAYSSYPTSHDQSKLVTLIFFYLSLKVPGFFGLFLFLFLLILELSQLSASPNAQHIQLNTDLRRFKIWSPPVTNAVINDPVLQNSILTTQYLLKEMLQLVNYIYIFMNTLLLMKTALLATLLLQTYGELVCLPYRFLSFSIILLIFIHVALPIIWNTHYKFKISVSLALQLFVFLL